MPIPGGNPPDLVSLDDVKLHLNITSTADDAELQGFIDAATAVIENITGPVTPTEYTEWHDGGQATVLLSRYPVTGVTSVTEYTPTAQTIAAEPTDGGVFTSYGYTIDTDTGVISRTSGGVPTRFTTGRVQVVYLAGRADVPPAIRLAALKLIKHMWADQRGSGAGRAIPGGTTDEYLPPETLHLIPWEVEELLAPYRKAPAVA